MLITVSIIIIYQNFFILKKSTVKCLLKQLYKNVIKIIKKMQNNKSVHIIMFNLRNNVNQIIFQSYILNDSGEKT